MLGGIAVPAYPPNGLKMQQSLDKLDIVIKDSGCKFCILSPNVEKLMRFYRVANELSIPTHFSRYLSKTKLDKSVDEYGNDFLSQISPDDILFLQYTSGSTGNPKGVIVTHHNMVFQIGKVIAKMGFLSEMFDRVLTETDPIKIRDTIVTNVVSYCSSCFVFLKYACA